MGILEKVSQYQDYLVELASVFDSDFAEDIVQEFYLLLHKYKVTEEQMFTNGKLNRGYCFIIIRNIHFQIYNVKKRITKCELNEEIYNMVDDFDLEKELDWNEFRVKAETEVNNWDWYDKKLFSIYRDTDISIRGLAKETGISFVSIFHSLKKHKEKLKELLKEDYDNLKL
jgi:hypothetical protein